MIFRTIERDGYTVELEQPTVFVDNEARGRSGHMTHAMTEFKPGCFIDFNSNCSALRIDGHVPCGWVEYRISEDAGKTYSDFHTLKYSFDSFLDAIHYISVEKAVTSADGKIIAFCLRNDAPHKSCCEPWATTTYITSEDFGKTWSEPKEYSPYAGRTYDAICHNGKIYVLHLCNPHFLGETEEHVYRIYISENNGDSFEELCVVPIEPYKRGYGAFIFDEKNALHVYAYNEANESEMDHAVSYDYGKTWTIEKPCYLAKGIRNPQVGLIDGVYVLHGRAGGAKGFVFYTSKDLYHWDEGELLIHKEKVGAFYSNNLNLSDENGNFLLVQYSDNYKGSRVNVMHMNVRIRR